MNKRRRGMGELAQRVRERRESERDRNRVTEKEIQ